MVKGNIEIGLNSLNLLLEKQVEQDKPVSNKRLNQWLPTGQYPSPCVFEGNFEI